MKESIITFDTVDLLTLTEYEQVNTLYHLVSLTSFLIVTCPYILFQEKTVCASSCEQ